MIEINITKDMLEKAEKLYSFGKLNNSITEGKSNIYGAIGEIAVMEYLNIDQNNCVSTYDYDILLNGAKLEVKTKKTTVIPQDHYLCSIADYNTKQVCDYYLFVRVKKDKSVAFLLGYMEKDTFFQESFFKKKGELDINNFTFKADCHNIKIQDLKDIQLLEKEIESKKVPKRIKRIPRVKRVQRIKRGSVI